MTVLVHSGEGSLDGLGFLAVLLEWVLGAYSAFELDLMGGKHLEPGCAGRRR